MFIGLSEELNEFDVYWFKWWVEWVWCLLVWESNGVSLMLIGLNEELSEFDVYWFEWDVEWDWCLLV